MDRICHFRRGNFKGSVGMYEGHNQNQDYTRQNYRGGYQGNYRNENYERGRSRSRERWLPGERRNVRSISNNRSRSGLTACTIRDRIRCYKFGEYDHFTKDCPTNKIEKEIDQIQQLYNMDEEQTPLKALATDTYDSLNRIDSLDEIPITSEHLNL